LAEILEAMEVSDTATGQKRQLLAHLLSHTHENFSETFHQYRRQKPYMENDDDSQGDVGSQPESFYVVGRGPVA